MMNIEEQLHSAASNINNFSEPMKKEIQVIGLGGAGCSTAKYLYEKVFKANYCCLTNAERTDLPSSFLFIEHHIYSKEMNLKIIQKRFKGNSEIPKPDLDTAIPIEIEERLKGKNRFILLVGLGGLTGSYWVKQLADYLKQTNKEFAVICTTPFNFEGEVIQDYASKVKDELAVLPNFYCFSNDRLREHYGNLPIKEAFAKSDEAVWEICEALYIE